MGSGGADGWEGCRRDIGVPATTTPWRVVLIIWGWRTRSTHVGERQIHLVFGIGEQSEPDDLLGHPGDFLIIIRCGEAGEEQEPATNST